MSVLEISITFPHMNYPLQSSECLGDELYQSISFIISHLGFFSLLLKCLFCGTFYFHHLWYVAKFAISVS